MSMTVRLPLVKASYVKTTCENLLSKDKFTIRVCPCDWSYCLKPAWGTVWGTAVHYWNLEINKTVQSMLHSIAM